MSETNALIEANQAVVGLQINEVKAQVQKIQALMKDVLVRDEHYGIIEGTKKNTLYKSGAEKILLTFRMRPEYEILEASTFRESFINYRVKCRLYHIGSDTFLAESMGSCNSKENKYAHTTPLNVDNTLLKMAQKRAMVAAVLNATAASDIFTQDLEDMDLAKQNQGSGAVSTGGGSPPPSPPVESSSTAPAPTSGTSVETPQSERGPLPYDLPPKGDDLRLDFVKWVDIQVQAGCLEDAWKLKQEDWKGRCRGKQASMLYAIYKKALDNVEPEGQPLRPEGADEYYDNSEIPF